MNEEEKKDLSRYFRLMDYMDEGSILLEEYEELEDIINRNKIAKSLEDARYQVIRGEISEDKYLEIEEIYTNELYQKMIDDNGFKKGL
jgi:hypothetical protein